MRRATLSTAHVASASSAPEVGGSPLDRLSTRARATVEAGSVRRLPGAAAAGRGATRLSAGHADPGGCRVRLRGEPRLLPRTWRSFRPRCGATRLIRQVAIAPRWCATLSVGGQAGPRKTHGQRWLVETLPRGDTASSKKRKRGGPEVHPAIDLFKRRKAESDEDRPPIVAAGPLGYPKGPSCSNPGVLQFQLLYSLRSEISPDPL